MAMATTPQLAIFVLVCFSCSLFCRAIQLDVGKANDKCQQVDQPCLFSETSIWVGGTAPTNGDDVSMIADANLDTNITLYIKLVLDVQLNNVQISGPVAFVIDLQGTVSIQQLGVDNESTMEVHDAVCTVTYATFAGDSSLTLSGQSNFTAQNYTSSQADLVLLDNSNLQGGSFVLAGLNTSDSTTVNVDNVFLFNGKEFLLEGSHQINVLTINNCFPNIFGGNFGSLNVLDYANVYLSENVTIGTIFMQSPNSLLFISSSYFYCGSLSGQGKIVLFDTEAYLGDENIVSDLSNIGIDAEGVVDATFTNVMFSNLKVDLPGSGVDNVTFYMNNVTLQAASSIFCTIVANEFYVYDQVEVQGTLNSTGDIIVYGSLTTANFVQTGGVVTVYGSISSPSITFEQSTIIANSSLIGTVSLLNSTLIAPGYLTIDGSLSIQESHIYATQLIITDYFFGAGNTMIHGNITASTINQEFGTLFLQGQLTAGVVTIDNVSLTITNPTVISTSAVSFDTVTMLLSASLYINGSAIMASYHLNGFDPVNSVIVDGSIYSSGESTITNATVKATSFTHVQNKLTMRGGSVAGPTIGFSSTRVVVESSSFFYGNVSFTASSLSISAPLTIDGILFVRNVNVFTTASQSSMLVTNQIVGNEVANFNGSVIVSTPLYTQLSGTVNLGGYFGAANIVLPSNTILAISYPTLIDGSVTVKGGQLQLHATTSVSGSFYLDTNSELMLYNNNNQDQVSSALYVNSSLSIYGNLVYWLSTSPIKQSAVSYPLVYFNKTLAGQFATHNTYGPNSAIVETKVKYGDHLIELTYSKHSQPGSSGNVGLIVGVVIGVAGFLIIVTFIVIFYYRYRSRVKYDAINELSEPLRNYRE